jgi:L,D-peptidoglycan transpeptidase YkuD (ErfK/YbiS/YcfS/YnhG family)
MKFFIALFILTGSFRASAFEIPNGSTQCLVGVSESWDSSDVSLRLYERKGKIWVPVSEIWQGRLGKNGLAWGKGLHPTPPAVAAKCEGDNRSPAGVFGIGGAWGSEAQIEKKPALPYHQVTSRDLWVEDSASPQYNCNVILDHEPATPWERKQQMKQNDPAQALKLFIAHNAPPQVIPNAGSSIFFHIWRDGGSRATAGCTTMKKSKLQWLIAQIDPKKQPLYVLLPKAEYATFKANWRLP